MSEEEFYEMEEFADMAIDELKSFLNEENKFVEEEHNLLDKLMSWDYVVLHIDERIPEEMEHIHELSCEISSQLIEIRDLIESGKLQDLKFVKEEEHILSKLKEDIDHKNWKVVKSDIIQEKKDEKKVLRLEKHELTGLYVRFAKLTKFMKESHLKDVIDKDSLSETEKDEFVKKEEYYFLEIYKFAKAYETIFKQLLEKEKHLFKKL